MTSTYRLPAGWPTPLSHREVTWHLNLNESDPVTPPDVFQGYLRLQRIPLLPRGLVLTSDAVNIYLDSWRLIVAQDEDGGRAMLKSLTRGLDWLSSLTTGTGNLVHLDQHYPSQPYSLRWVWFPGSPPPKEGGLVFHGPIDPDHPFQKYSGAAAEDARWKLHS